MQSSTSKGRLGGAAVGALFAALLTAHASAQADEPGVARLSAVNGNVAIKRGDTSTTFGAVDNAPVMAADYVTTGNGESRAEVQFDYGTFLRLGQNVQMRVSRLDPSAHVVQLAAGTVELSQLRVTGANPEIDTPSIAVHPNGAGQYRVTVNPDGSTLVSSRSGSVTLNGASANQTVYGGSTVLVTGTPANPRFEAVTVLAYDAFDSWNQTRDAFDGNDSGYQYANNQIVGIPDLSSNGTWANSAQYGYGWTPGNVASSWAPYQNGQWVWEPYYGYTWVGNESWGWAPYHYGTWLYNSDAWTWYPNAGPQYPSGQYPYVGSSYPTGYPAASYPSGYGTGSPSTYGSAYQQYGYGSGYPPYSNGYPYNYGYPYPVQNTSSLLWAPALVTFLGLLGGQNPATALASGSLAWSPLGPGEMAYPWYGPQQAAWYGYQSSGYPNYQTYAYGAQPVYGQGNTMPVYAAGASVVNSYNTYTITKIYKIYRNTRAPHGVMVVSAKAFRSGAFGSIRSESLAQTHLNDVAVFRNVVPVAPTAANLRFASVSGAARVAAIAPRIALFSRFPAVRQAPASFATVQSHIADTTQKLYATRPSMPGPVLAHHVLTAPKPQMLVRRPETTRLRTGSVPAARPRSPVRSNKMAPGQRYDAERGTARSTYSAPEHADSAPQRTYAAPQQRRYMAPAPRPFIERQAPVEHRSAPPPRPQQSRPAPAEHGSTSNSQPHKDQNTH